MKHKKAIFFLLIYLIISFFVFNDFIKKTNKEHKLRLKEYPLLTREESIDDSIVDLSFANRGGFPRVIFTKKKRVLSNNFFSIEDSTYVDPIHALKRGWHVKKSSMSDTIWVKNNKGKINAYKVYFPE